MIQELKKVHSKGVISTPKLDFNLKHLQKLT